MSQSTTAEENEDRNQPDRTLIRLLTTPVPAELRLFGITSRPNRLTQTQKTCLNNLGKNRENLSPAQRNCNRKLLQANSENVLQQSVNTCNRAVTSWQPAHKHRELVIAFSEHTQWGYHIRTTRRTCDNNQQTNNENLRQHLASKQNENLSQQSADTHSRINTSHQPADKHRETVTTTEKLSYRDQSHQLVFILCLLTARWY